MNHSRLLCSLFLISCFVPAVETFAAETPNFVVIFCDDLGYRDVGCFGSPHIKTPNVDRIAKEGIRFTDFYSAYCVCSASRASLLTGCYQPRINMPGVIGPHSGTALNPAETTIAEVLKTKGYATACVGKWHVGDSPATLPTAQGFDSYFGIPYSNDMARIKGWGNNAPDLDKIWKEKRWDIYKNELYRDTKIIESPVNQVTLTKRYADESVKFIRDHKNEPFFLYLAQAMPHVPLFVPDDVYDPDPKKAYQLTIEHIDWAVGEILNTLDELELTENTFVVFTSDNGPWLSKQHHAGSALPLRAGKATTFEGGMRVPCVMRWPAKIKSGQTCQQVAGTIDLLPTFAKIVGAALDETKPIDGLEITSLLENPQTESPHDEVGYYYYRNGRPEAIRLGKWKLKVNRQGRGPKAAVKVELYDLRADIGESKDVSKDNPEVVSRLQSVMSKYDADLKANSRPAWKRGT